MKKTKTEAVIEMKEEKLANHDEMKEIILRFPHVAKNIFENLDLKDLRNCLLVHTQWYNFITNENFLMIKKIQRLRNIYKQSKDEKWNKVMKTAKKDILQKLLIATQDFFCCTKPKMTTTQP